MKRVTIVLGSDGKNNALAKKFETTLRELGASVSILDLVSLNYPLYSPKCTQKGSDLLAPIQSELGAEAFVFIGPEYNGGIPPVMTNFLAWASTSSKDWRLHFNAKKAAIATHSGGDGLFFLTALRLQLSYIGMNVLGRQLNVNDRKEADPKSILDICSQLIS